MYLIISMEHVKYVHKLCQNYCRTIAKLFIKVANLIKSLDFILLLNQT